MWDPGCLVGCVTDVQDLWVWHSMACIFYNSVLWHLQSTICRSLTISDGLWRSLTISGDLWRSLAISDDLWRSHGIHSNVWCLFVQLRHLLEFLWVEGSGLPDSSTAGCGSLQMSMLRHAATNPPIFNHRCQCFQTWNDTEMGFPTCYLVRLCYGFQTTRATVFGIRQC